MNDERELTAEEVGSRIAAGMGLVHDLFKEMNSLLRLIAQGLRDSEADVQLLGPKSYILPRAKKGATIADRYLCTDLGLLVQIGGSSDEDSEEEFDAGDDDGEDEVETDNTTASITPASQYLGIRAVLYDPHAPTEKFTPALVGAVFSSLTKQPTGKKVKKVGKGGEQKTFSVKRTALKRVVKLLDPGLKPGQTVSARITGAQLAAKVVAIKVTPLGEFDSEMKVARFTEKLVEMVENA